MKVLFLSSGVVDPATRFRIGQFLPRFEAAGIHCEHHGAYGSLYNRLFQTPLGGPYKLAGRLRRTYYTLRPRRFDVVFLQRTAFNTTALPEEVMARWNSGIVFDFDDAVFLHTTGRTDPRRERAFRNTVGISTRVIAGNSYLAEWAAAPDRTTVIPTVIDTAAFKPPIEARSQRAPLTVGWMGTAGNFPYLETILPPILRLLSERSDLRFRIVSNATFGPLRDHPQVDQSAWTAEREISDLQAFDVGIMPLDDTPWTRGKCGFKMIQYMAVGRPVVASAVGANVEILSGSGAGHLVADAAGWYEALCSILTDEQQRRVMGAAARKRIEDRYSIDAVIDRYLSIFEEVAREGRRRSGADGGRSVGWRRAPTAR